MHLHFSWTRYRFTAPQEITEAQYAAARERPDELRRSVSAQVRAAARHAGLAVGLAAAAAAGCFWLASRFDFTDPDAWEAVVGTILCAGGVALAFSAVFTAGSFLHYAAAATGFWRAVARAAHACPSYPDFVTAWTRRQRVGVGVDRKLPWWISWLVLAGVLLGAYAIFSWSQK